MIEITEHKNNKKYITYKHTNIEKKLEKDNFELFKMLNIMKDYFDLIISLGYDYDGLNQVESLKGLIDELVRLAKLGKECNTKEVVYTTGDKNYNICKEELK